MLSHNLLLAGDDGYNLTNSLRFRSGASAYLNRTPSSASNRKTWTYSVWFKRGTLGTGYLFGATTDSWNVNWTLIYLNSSNNLFVQDYATSERFNLSPTMVFRDPSAWYHLVVAVDTTQATASNRIKIYVNGVQVTAFNTASYPTQNLDTFVDNNVAHQINGTGGYFDGYFDEVNFIDGQALTPSSFGSTNPATGVWQPKKYIGTYGTNGFYLPFTNTTSTSTLGNDFSGNSNTWTVNNISLTAGATYDSMTDVPTLTSATQANYCVLNPLITGNVITNVNGNLQASLSASSNAYFNSVGTIPITSGKWYWEYTVNTIDTSAGQWMQFGIVSSTTTYTNNALGFSGNMSAAYAYYNDGFKAGNGTTASYAATFTTGDVIGVAFDDDAGTLTFYKNGTSQGQAFSGISSTIQWLPIIQMYRSTGTNQRADINFGQRPFAYTPPTGFVALNTFNLPISSIVKGNTVMDATLFNGTSGNVTVVNDGGFEPDLVWLKSRNIAQGHGLYNTIITGSYVLQSNTTGAEIFLSNPLLFNSNGFTSTTDSHTNGYTYVGWQWKAGGTAVTNTAGSITSTVSANTSAGFSVVTFTTAGASATIGHGLGVAPRMVIMKDRTNAASWLVYNASLASAANYLVLNATDASASNTTVWNNTAPTSSVFSIGTVWAASNYVAYCFAQIAGYSAFGSYTGNGSTDGTFLYLGFRPKFVLIKSTGSQDWVMLDSARSPYNVAGNYLRPNSSGAENGGSTPTTSTNEDFLSNGIKFRNDASSSGYTNGSGVTYIYMAFAENPFKNSLAR